VTLSNDWYFRVVPTNPFMANFIANYIHKIFRQSRVTIVSDRDNYGSSLLSGFEGAALKLGMEIRKTRSFSRRDKNLDNELKKIVAELRLIDNPGVIFFATHADEGVRILTLLRQAGTNYIIIGPNSFTGQVFIRNLRKYPLERTLPGYYSDGIYGVAPFMMWGANREVSEFRQEYVRKYKEEPNWLAACYYDAMQVAVEAIELSDLRGDNIRRDRRAVMNSLKSLNSDDISVRGITGNIYFDENGDFNRPFPVGVYDKQHFLPAFLQYQEIRNPPGGNTFSDRTKKTADRSREIICGTPVSKTRMVYTGIDINEISNVDIENSEYTIDFYLWFRFKGDFPDTNIVLPDAVEQSRGYDLHAEKKTGDITVRTYHMKTAFRRSFDFFMYPFDRQMMRIRFRHADKTRERLVYVPDIMRMPGTRGEKIGKVRMDEVIGWNIDDISFYQNIVGISEDSDQKTDYSQFNADIRLSREGLMPVIRVFLPVFIILIISYSVYFIPPEQSRAQTYIFLSALATTFVYHMALPMEDFFHLSVVGYVFLTAYGLLLMSAFVSFMLRNLVRRGNRKIARVLIRMGRIIHPSLVLITGFLIYMMVLRSRI